MWAKQKTKQEKASADPFFSSMTIGFVTIGLREHNPSLSATPAAADLLGGVMSPEVGGDDTSTNTRRR
jgi:hypothetical protein